MSTILGYPWGGADALWTRTASGALARGHDVLVAVSPVVAAHPRVGFDISPGVELLYNLSQNREQARNFFIRHADRIYFGTDAGLLQQAPVESVEARIRLMLRFLTTSDTFRLPADADFLLGPPEDGIVKGLDLPVAVLERILVANARQRMGARPKPLGAGCA